jgi:cytochrome c oxidase subunit 2
MQEGIAMSMVFLLYFSNSAMRMAGNKESPVAERVIKVGTLPPSDATIKEFDIDAIKYEFKPGIVEVPMNTLVKSHLKTLDREHGFEIQLIKDSCRKFKPGEPVTVKIYAEKTGEFEFTCCKFCGLGHKEMKGKVIIK